jgi:hypothetical protein
VGLAAAAGGGSFSGTACEGEVCRETNKYTQHNTRHYQQNELNELNEMNEWIEWIE